jgi:hypothetical protein
MIVDQEKINGCVTFDPASMGVVSNLFVFFVIA